MRRDVQLYVSKERTEASSTSSSSLITNGDFSAETNWTTGTNGSYISGGEAKLDMFKTNTPSILQTGVATVAGGEYNLSVSNVKYGAAREICNFHPRSQDFDNAAWLKTRCSITANTDIAPDGTLTADRYEITSTSGLPYVYINTPENNGYDKTISVYVKAVNSTVNVGLLSFGSFASSAFSLVTGTVSSSGGAHSNAAIEYAGNGWYRISTVYNRNSSGTAATAFYTSGAALGDQFLVWGFQQEAGPVLNPYVRTYSSSVWDMVDEKQDTATTLSVYSEAFDSPYWTKYNGAFITANAVLNQRYRSGGDLITRTSSAAGHSISQTKNFGSYAARTMTASVFAKRGAVGDYLSIKLQGSSSYHHVEGTLNFNTGLLGGFTTFGDFDTLSYGAQNMYNGWYRIWITASTDVYNNVTLGITPKVSAGGSFYADSATNASAYITGAMLEESDHVGEYVIAEPYYPTTVSRQDNTFLLSDTTNGTGVLNQTIVLTEGTESYNFTINPIITGGNVYIRPNQTANTHTFSVGDVSMNGKSPKVVISEYKKIDLFDFEDINIIDKIKDVRDISKVFTEYTHQFTVPASSANSYVFDHFYNADLLNGFDARLKHNAVIKIGGADYKHGKISLTSSSLKNGVPYSYSLVFYGNTVTLKDLIGDDKLTDLSGTLLDELNFEFSAANVRNLFETGMNYDSNYNLALAGPSETRTPDLFTPFISCDSHYFYDSLDQAQVKDRVDSRNVRYNSAQPKRGIYYKDLKMALKVKFILKAIEQKYGITFSDDFFNENIKEFNELCIFLHREKGGISNQLESSTDGFTLSQLVWGGKHTDWRGVGGASFKQDTDGWDKDYLSIVDQVEYNVTAPRVYTTRMDFTVAVVGGGEYTIEIIDGSSGADGNSDYLWTGTGDKLVSHVFKSGTVNTGANEPYKYMYVKPRVRVTTQSGISEYAIEDFTLQYVWASTSNHLTIPSESWNLDHSQSITAFSYDDENGQVISDGVDVTAQLPNMKTLDFLTSLFKMFNLTAYFVPETDISRFSGQIRVRPLDSYYLSGKKVDLSRYIDTSTTNVKRNNLFSSIEYEYAPHKTLASIKQNQRTADIFGSELLNNLSGSLYAPVAFDGGKYKVKSNFEKVMYERMTDQADETTVLNFQWGWMASKDENPVLGEALLFYPIRTSLDDSYDSDGEDVVLDFDTSVYDKDGIATESNHSALLTYFRPSNSLEGNLQSLHFGSEYDEWYVWEGAGSNENSLFQNYHKNYILSIYDKQSRLVDFNAYLPVDIIMKLNLQDIVIINERKYRINTLSLNLSTGKARLELMNDIAYSYIVLNKLLFNLIEEQTRYFLFSIIDPDESNDTVFKMYVDGVFYQEVSESSTLRKIDFSAGEHVVTVRKAKYYDATTFIESEDSEPIYITI